MCLRASAISCTWLLFFQVQVKIIVLLQHLPNSHKKVPQRNCVTTQKFVVCWLQAKRSTIPKVQDYLIDIAFFSTLPSLIYQPDHHTINCEKHAKAYDEQIAVIFAPNLLLPLQRTHHHHRRVNKDSSRPEQSTCEYYDKAKFGNS